jgi:DNA-binding MarR family transcriptional regulator
MDDAARRLEREINTLGQHLRARPKSMELRLDRSAYLVLLLLDCNGPQTLKEIATAMELEQSTVNRQVNRAIERGLLESVPSATGPRLIRPTDEGAAAFQRDRAVKLQGIASILGDLDTEHRESLIAGLTALNSALESRAERS